MILLRRTLLLSGVITLAPQGFAADKTDAAAVRDAAIALSKELRDPSSANFSLFESESAIAGQLKAEIYNQVAQGKSREEILHFFAERYGESIRYAPRFSWSTAALYGAPWVFLAAAFWIAKRQKHH